MASLQVLRGLGKISTLMEAAGVTSSVWYAQKGAPADIVSLVALGNKKFGSIMEHITCNLFDCTKVKDEEGKTGWDMNKNNSRFELKSSRFWRVQNKHFWRWQHILADHEWAYLMCAGVDFQQIRYFALSKPQFINLIELGIITQQGGAGGQGCWFCSEDILGRIHEFKTPTAENGTLSEQLDTFITENPASCAAISTEAINAALLQGTQVREKKKEAKKEKREAEKAAKEADKAAKKEKRDAERAAKKAVKEAEKAAKKEKRDAERAAKKAAKEADKAAKKAERALKKSKK